MVSLPPGFPTKPISAFPVPHTCHVLLLSHSSINKAFIVSLYYDPAYENISSFSCEKLSVILCVGLCVRVSLCVCFEGVDLNSPHPPPCLSTSFRLEIRRHDDRVYRSMQNA
jgi:hypothetical protein